MLEELKEKEAKLAAELEPVGERYHRLVTELAMVRHGIAMLKPKQPRGPKMLKWTKERVLEVISMRDEGKSWQEIGQTMGLSPDATQKSFHRAESRYNAI